MGGRGWGGVSSACHMSMHLMTVDFKTGLGFKTVSSCGHLLETNGLRAVPLSFSP